MPKLPKTNKFAISLQHVKKEVNDAVDFLNADKHERLLKMMVMVKNSQTSQNGKFVMSLQYL